MKTVAIVTWLTTLTFAAPSKPAHDARSALICLYMTADINWQGEGLNLCEYPGQCANEMPDGLSKQVSSAGPDAGATCYLYSETDCGGIQSEPLVNPGLADLSDIWFNDLAMSWKCDYS